MEYLFIYLLQIFDTLSGIKCLFGVGAVICLITCVVSFIAKFESYGDDRKFFGMLYSNFKKSTIVIFIIWLFLLLIPTRDTLLFLGGAYFGKKAVKQAVTSEKLQKIDTIINLELDKRIKELKNAR